MTTSCKWPGMSIERNSNSHQPCLHFHPLVCVSTVCKPTAITLIYGAQSNFEKIITEVWPLSAQAKHRESTFEANSSVVNFRTYCCHSNILGMISSICTSCYLPWSFLNDLFQLLKIWKWPLLAIWALRGQLLKLHHHVIQHKKPFLSQRNARSPNKRAKHLTRSPGVGSYKLREYQKSRYNDQSSTELQIYILLGND